jgi:hypothetical protein
VPVSAIEANIMRANGRPPSIEMSAQAMRLGGTIFARGPTL